MFSYYNPVAPQAQAAKPAKKSKAKSTPLPCFIPVALYESVRISCTYLALDDNPSNPLNAHKDPILKTFKGSIVAVYSQDLLKHWLRFLGANPLWSQTVVVDKQVKSKKGHLTQTTTSRVKAMCIVVPTDNDIVSVAGDDQQLGSELTFVALQLRRYLVKRMPGENLYQPGEVPLGSVPSQSVVTTPVNVVKQDRLHRLGYGKVALKGQDAVMWESFYKAEAARLKYALSEIFGITVNDAAINSLSNEDADLHNSLMVANMLETSPEAAGYMSHEGYIDKSNKGTAVNPALIAHQRAMSNARAVRVDNPDTKAYQDMIDEYKRLTGFGLDLKAERAQKSLPFRLHEIERAYGLMSSDPYVTVGHNHITGRMYPIRSDSPSHVMPVFQPETQTRPKVQQQSQVQQQSLPQTQKLQSLPQTQPHRQQLYGSLPAQPRVQSTPSDVQKYMSGSPTYVPSTTSSQKQMYPVPDGQPGQMTPSTTSSGTTSANVPNTTLSSDNIVDMFTVPTIRRDNEDVNDADVRDEEDEEDPYYPDADEDTDVVHSDQQQQM